MIWGTVSGRPEARVRLRLRGPDDTTAGVTATVDTGYSGMLTLPDRLVVALGLEYLTDIVLVQADGSAAMYPTYTAELEWGDSWRVVLVAVVGNEALLGMKLLLGHELRVAVVPGGAVEIAPLG